ncbi:QcrA and Rieske domain-containing protein [Draconibacterium halophilum]|uniref:Rieske (2Fe-2S) protein n=1 Tax=Draconibacterium halophilum TaxID=2706887 RepID=A0A6C0RIR1_9BACT|nr:Rieske (2Fe-2S) protein [Draconibacterium halophilum]QIA09742.1 Rieske (2Fe-2S) protein [Draconibacterium halophilum]
MEIKNRRVFLKVAAVGFISFFVFIWNKLTLRHIVTTGTEVASVPLNKNKEVQFFDKFIIVNSDHQTTVFSSHCSHLGCKIDKMENGKLVCPCHGSEYDLHGEVIKGPAYKNLTVLNSSVSDDEKSIIIKG